MMRRAGLVVGGGIFGGGLGWAVSGPVSVWLYSGGWLWLLPPLACVIAYFVLRHRIGFPERARQVLAQALPGDGKKVWLVRARNQGGVWHLSFRLSDPLQITDLLRKQASFGPALGASIVLWPDRGRQPLLHMRASTLRLPGPSDLFETAEFKPRERPPLTYEEFYKRCKAPPGVLVFGLGDSTRGPLWADLAYLPHLLVGGQTGTGKSAFLRQLLTYLLSHYGPDQLQLLAIDLKGGSEFGVFADFPHLPVPPISQVDECAHAITQLGAALHERLEIFRQQHVQNLEELEQGGLKLPRIAVVIDEVTSLAYREIVKVAPEEATLRYTALEGLATLARLGRAAGIHLVVATQRPDPDVLPGQLLANVGASVAFGVRNLRDSEVILREGDSGAAFLPRLPGRGLYVHGMAREEFQTPFLSGKAARRLLEQRYVAKGIA